MCRKGAWAELTVEVTAGSNGSKPDARFKMNMITEEYIVLAVYSFCKNAIRTTFSQSHKYRGFLWSSEACTAYNR